jgi:hypothetical protein
MFRFAKGEDERAYTNRHCDAQGIAAGAKHAAIDLSASGAGTVQKPLASEP